MEAWFDTIRPIRIPRPKLMSNRTTIDINILDDHGNQEHMAPSITSMALNSSSNGNHNNSDMIVTKMNNGSINNESYPREPCC
uniref:Uncharacterized protein LOC113791122 n=1 Tax=Dermatophagoides pteronyssinus TaxID=6956 RepID=A0A6P6XUX9_DERPT|nr:uncharacterized protein LOC113791122 [Dermatophagoides pteronyssinus]